MSIGPSTGRFSQTAQVLTDHGPKILLLPVVVRQSGAAGFFDKVRLTTTVGFAFAGSVPPALATHAVCSAVLQSLIALASAPLPSFCEIAEFVRRSSEQYMRDWGVLSPNGARFSSLVFGRCPINGTFEVVHIAPTRESVFSVAAVRVDTSQPTAIGSGAEAFHNQLKTIQRDGDPFGRTARLPLLALEGLVSGQSQTDVGGAIQLARADFAGVELYTRTTPVVPGKPEAKMTFLGIDVRDLGPVGQCIIGMTSVA
jgi:hypothetical protein